MGASDAEREALRGADDAPLLLEVGEHVAEAVVADAEEAAELAAREGTSSAAQGVDDSVAESVGLRRRATGVARADDLEMCAVAVVVRDETEVDGVLGGRGAMLEGEAECVGGAREVRAMIDPRMQIGTAAERLPEMRARAFGHMVDEENGDIVRALELAEVAEERGDFARVVFVARVEADERIENEELGAEPPDGGEEALLVGGGVEANGGRGDDVEIEGIEGDAAVSAEGGDACAHLGQGVFREEGECGSRLVDLKAIEHGRSGGDADGHVEPEPALGAFWLSTANANSGGPDAVDEPRLRRRRVGELAGADGRKALGVVAEIGVVGHGKSDFRAAAT